MGGRRAVSGLGSSIPQAITSLLGRADEVAAIRLLVAQERLVTLTGTGGVGKTRLAAEVASEIAEAGVMVQWVDVAPCSSVEMLQSSISTRIGATDLQEHPWHLNAAEALLGRECVLVLDNCEHLLDAVAALVTDLIHEVPTLCVMLTSREPLGVTGETIFRVPSLSVGAPGRMMGTGPRPTATELFIQRACDVRPDLLLDDAQLETIDAICTRLDGIPLAIELAAARTRHMSPASVLDGLQDRFRLLTGGERSALARHRTMRMSMDWSYRLLDDEEQCALRVLSVFRDWFSLDAGSALVSRVCGCDTATASDAIGGLVDKSMVTFDGERYWLLDTVRAYATEITGTGELHSSRDAHAEWFSQWLAELTRLLDRAGAHIQIAAYEPDVLAALEWSQQDPLRAAAMAARLGDFWYGRSRVSDTRRLGLGTLDIVREVDSTSWARLACSLALACVAAGCSEFLATDLPRAVAIVEQEGLDYYAAWGHAALAFHTQSWKEGAAALAAAQRTGRESFVTRAASQLYIIGLATAEPSTLADAIAAIEARPANSESPGGQMMRISLGYRDHIKGMLDAAAASFTALLAIPDVDPTIELTSGIAVCLSGLMLDDPELAELGLEASRAVASRRQRQGLSEVLSWVFTPRDDPPPLEALAIPFVALWRNVGALALLDAGRPDTARLLLALPPTDAAPGSYLAVADAAVEASLAQLAGDEGVEKAWVDILTQAHLWGYPLLAVDAFEALAVHSTGVPRVARRLQAAAHRLRDETGYRHRFAFQQAWVDETEAATAGPTQQSSEELDWQAVAAWVERGRRERHRPSLGWPSLTRTEQSVVELVAVGLTNPEIGERLLMSRATVKTHIAHVFTKLDVRTRTELATAWHQRNSH